MMLDLYQCVMVNRDVPEVALKAGDVAWLIDYARHPEGGEDVYVLEIYDAEGECITVTRPIAVCPSIIPSIMMKWSDHICLRG